MSGIDYYDRLGVSRTADQTEIRRAYLAAAKQHHPDAGGSDGMFRLIRLAYETLGDPARRADYDSALTGPAAEVVEELQEFEDPVVPRLTAMDIPWWSGVDPDAGIQWRSRLAPIELAFVISTGLWAILAVAAIAVALTDLPVGVAALVLLLLFLAPTAVVAGRATLGREPNPTIRTATTVAGTLLLFVTAGLLAEGQLWAAPLGVLAADSVALTWLARGYAPYRRRRIDWQANVCRFLPGWERELTSTPDQEAAAEATFDLLSQYLTHIPAVRILRDPPGFPAEIDHVVLCGRRLILISSVRWPPGRYSIDSTGQIRRDGRLLTGRLHLPEAVRHCRRHFRGTEVHGVVLLWPARATQQVITAWTPDRAIDLIGAQTLVTDVGAWLAEHPTTVHRGLLRAVMADRPIPLSRS